ncbi:MAG: fibronectin type III domain-containing protein [Terriglobales bacterium]
MRNGRLSRSVPFSTARLAPAVAVFICTAASLVLLTACGSSGSSSSHGLAPIFTSVPVTAATQDVAYSYQLAAVDPSGGSVTFALTTGPTGATISGSTISWTPTGAQSRVSNNFEVTATTTSGATATQSWMVTPGGTITVNWVNNYWEASGAVQVPALASAGANLSAMWTNADGSITVQKGSATSPGVFSIPNVPAGYYWLQIGTAEAFWTNVSTFDAGSNIAGGPLPTTSTSQSTSFLFNLSGLESVGELTPVYFDAAVSGVPESLFIDNANSTSLDNLTLSVGNLDIDWSKISTVFLLQYVPAPPLGPLNNLVIGPSSILTGLTFVDGQQNPITEQLQASTPASIDVNVPGASQWGPLLSNVAPATPVPFGSALLISAQMYVTQGLATGSVPLSSPAGITQFLTLAGTAEQGIPLGTANCAGTGFALITPTAPQAAITTDENFGTLTYGDPFPSNWARTVSLCQESTVAIPVPDSSATATFILTDGATAAPSNTPLAPVVLPVQSPTISGGSFFGASSLNSNVVTLSWTAPTGTAPFGYTVRAYVQTAAGGIPTYAATGGALSTAATSITLPPLAGGNTYVFSITADADGSANMLMSPFRSSLPTGYATVVSGPVTISSSALMPEIHGDRRAVERYSKPEASAVVR